MAHELSAGHVLDTGKNKYTVRSVLGSGGFGITYSATFSTQIGNLPVQVVVAIKEHFLKSDCDRDASQAITYSRPVSERVNSSLRTFVSEARRLQKISGGHPNIVHVSEVFSANNTAYYVMEYIEGRSLSDYVKEHGALSWDETIGLLLPVIDATAYLHRNRITHLDIKPANVMLAQENGTFRPVLIDFGLSKHYNEDGSATSTIGTQGFSEGFAPVEQYVGISEFSPASDVYSLGATMLYCLTGKIPPKALNLDEKTLDSLIPASVPAAGRKVLKEALAMRTADRLPDAGALLNALKSDDTVVIGNGNSGNGGNNGGGGNNGNSGNCGNNGGDKGGDNGHVGDKPAPKNWLKILLIVIGVLAVGACVWFFVSTKSSNSYEDEEEAVEYTGPSALELDSMCFGVASAIHSCPTGETDMAILKGLDVFKSTCVYMLDVEETGELRTAAAKLMGAISTYLYSEFVSESTRDACTNTLNEISERPGGRRLLDKIDEEARGYIGAFEVPEVVVDSAATYDDYAVAVDSIAYYNDSTAYN